MKKNTDINKVATAIEADAGMALPELRTSLAEAQAVRASLDASIGVIVPPGGWRAQTQWGLLRSDKTEAGKLVRLAALVQWLIDAKELPCGEAVELVCAVLDTEAAGALFVLDETGYAKPVDAAHRFDHVPIVSGGARFWNSFAESSAPASALCGVAGAIRAMRRFWTTAPVCSVYEAAGLECLAVPLRLAFEAWAYGHLQAPAPDDAASPLAIAAHAALADSDVVDLETLLRYRKQYADVQAQQRPGWKTEHVAILRAAVDGAGRGGVKALAEQLGVSAQGLRDVLKRHQPPMASPFPTVRRA